MALTVSVEVPPRDREVLASWVRSTSIRAGLAQRARIVLLAADGLGTNEIVRRAGGWLGGDPGTKFRVQIALADGGKSHRLHELVIGGLL